MALYQSIPPNDPQSVMTLLISMRGSSFKPHLGHVWISFHTFTPQRHAPQVASTHRCVAYWATFFFCNRWLVLSWIWRVVWPNFPGDFQEVLAGQCEVTWHRTDTLAS